MRKYPKKKLAKLLEDVGLWIKSMTGHFLSILRGMSTSHLGDKIGAVLILMFPLPRYWLKTGDISCINLCRPPDIK
jgi:hypothetical protein